MRKLGLTAVALAAFSSGVVWAATDDAPTVSSSDTASAPSEPAPVPEVGQHHYIAILPALELPDTKRGVNRSGVGLSVLYGHSVTPHIGFEINGKLSLFTTGHHNGTDVYQEGGTVDLVLNLFDREDRSWWLHPFAVIGAGGAYDDYSRDGRDRAEPLFDAGLGLVTNPFYHGIKLRTEARYYRDGVHATGDNDVRVSLGIEIPLGSRVARVVELAPPEPQIREVVRQVEKPWIDSDGDGVPDERDKCPDTPHGLKVDADGCVIPDQVIALRGVTFEFNKTRLTPNAQAVLDTVVKAFVGQPGLKVEIGGHTDSIGSVSYNLRLSQGRADAVRNYLISQGAKPDQLTAVGYGKSRPLISPERNADDRELNRRVEFKVIGN